jgi:C4-dicarboxylate transporter DctM subunit
MPALMVFVVFITAIAVGIPIAIAMVMGAMVPVTVYGTGSSFVQLINNSISGANSTPILAVPLFILAGVIMAESGISRRLFNFFSYFVGNIPGGLPCASIITCLFYGAISGSGPATTAPSAPW